MDIAPLDVIVPRLATTSSDMELVTRLNDFRFQLHHINRRLTNMLDLGVHRPTGLPILLKNAAGTTLDLVTSVQQKGKSLLTALDK